VREILGKAKTVRELLKGVKYSIDYYQREYKVSIRASPCFRGLRFRG
jgi:hypothetical protein